MFPSDSDIETNVTLETERTGVIDEPPFRLLMLGDWSGDAEKSELARRNPIEIDRDNFDDVMKKLRVSIEIEIEGGSVSLDFQMLDDFHPDEIFKQVSIFSDLRDLRRRVNNESTFTSAAREIRGEFGETATTMTEPETKPPSATDNLLDAILSKPDGGAAPPKLAASSELNNFISGLVRPHFVTVNEDEVKSLTAAVDDATGELMRKILHNRKFQELEAAWRGLFFLIRRAETSTDLKIYVLDISQQALSTELKNAASLPETVLYRHLVKDAAASGDPWAAAVANYAYEPVVDDVAALVRISKIAMPSKTPFVSHMRPEVLGINSLAEHPDPIEWVIGGESAAAKLWAALRSQEEARYLGMTIPRVLARLPYGEETDPSESFTFEEIVGLPDHDEYLWTNSAFIVALLLAQSFSEYGWAFGQAFVQDMDGLPVHMYKKDGQMEFKSCAEVQLSQNACEALMEYGLMPIVSFKNSDRVRLARFQSITDPVRTLKGRWT